ncbi:unnamed protein product, partial [Closterium sp. NIES-53]
AGGAGAADGTGTTPRREFSTRSRSRPRRRVTRSFARFLRREPETRASTPVRARHVARPRPPGVPGTHGMALRPSSIPQRLVLPEPPASSLPHVPDPESDLAHAASPTVTRLLTTVITLECHEPAARSSSSLSLDPAGCCVALPCQSRCSAGRRVTLLPARRIATYTSPCLARAEPPCCPHRLTTRHPTVARPTTRSPAARAPPCWQPHRCLHRPSRDTLLCAALLAGALLPAEPYYALPRSSHHPLAAPPTMRSPTGRHPTARPCAASPCPAHLPSARAPPCLRAALLVSSRPALPTMASLRVLKFDHEGRPIQFDTWLDELQQYLLSDSRDSVSLLDRTSGASLAPPATANSITLYFIVTRLLDSLRAVRDHFLALDPTNLTIDLLEKHLLAVETSPVAVGAARGTPRTPFFEGCSPSPLAPSYASTAAVDILGAEDVEAASALSGKNRSSKGKGGKSGGGGSEGGGGGGSGGGGGGGGSGSGGSGGGSGGFGGGGGGSGGGGGGGGGGSGSGGGGNGGGRGGVVQRGGSGGDQRNLQQRQSETPAPQQLRDHAGQTCGKLHTQHRCFSLLDDAWRTEFGDEAEHPRWSELFRSGVDIFCLDYDAILAAMYALFFSAEGDCYLFVPPDTGIDAAALGASESALPGTAPAEAVHTFTLYSGASRCFFRVITTLMPLPAPVPVRQADPSGGSVLARSSTVLPCPSVPSSSLSGLHLPSFFTNLVSTAALQDAMVRWQLPARIASCRTRLSCGTTALVTPPCHAFMACTPASLFLVFPGLCLASCPRLPRPAFLALRGGSTPLLTPRFPRRPSLQTLHMDAWGPARVSGQDRERYFLLVIDNYTRYTTVFPLRNKGEVPDVLVP